MQTRLWQCVVAMVVSAGLFQACTRHDPFTGQQQIDYGATAGMAGMAMGAAALGVAASNRNNFHRRDVVVVNRPVYRPYVGHRGFHGGHRAAFHARHRGGFHGRHRGGFHGGHRGGRFRR